MLESRYGGNGSLLRERSYGGSYSSCTSVDISKYMRERQSSKFASVGTNIEPKIALKIFLAANKKIHAHNAHDTKRCRKERRYSCVSHLRRSKLPLYGQSGPEVIGSLKKSILTLRHRRATHQPFQSAHWPPG